MKITIIGHCGSGKSTLAKAISKTAQIPYLELDRLFFAHGGAQAYTPEEKQSVKANIKESTTTFLAENQKWVSDGVYLTSVQPTLAAAADTIILIDIPLHIRMINHLKRWWQNVDRHPEISRFQDLLFTFDMVRRTRSSQPKLEQIAATYPDKLLLLKSHKEIRSYLEQLSISCRSEDCT